MSRSPVAFGRYIITRRIARGGMAEIYRARTRSAEDPTQARWVALKMMRPSIGHEALREQLFKREARICSAIHHPNIVPLYEFGREQDRYYISMEFIRGRDLSHLIKSAELNPDSGPESDSEPVSFGAGMYIAVQAAKGLGHAHRLVDDDGVGLQIVHRDVSPGNVMVGYDGSVKVLDFGVARINESQGLRTQTGTLRGKFAYMAPEQTLGLPVDARSDIFSFGIVLYQLLTGSTPFRGRSSDEVFREILHCRVPPPSAQREEIPACVDELVLTCLQRDRSLRYSRGESLIAEIHGVLEKLGIHRPEERLREYLGDPQHYRRVIKRDPIDALKAARPSPLRQAIKPTLAAMTMGLLLGSENLLMDGMASIGLRLTQLWSKLAAFLPW